MTNLQEEFDKKYKLRIARKQKMPSKQKIDQRNKKKKN